MKFEVVDRKHVKLASIFCRAGSENLNYFDIIQTVFSLYVFVTISCKCEYSFTNTITKMHEPVSKISLFIASAASLFSYPFYCSVLNYRMACLVLSTSLKIIIIFLCRGYSAIRKVKVFERCFR